MSDLAQSFVRTLSASLDQDCPVEEQDKVILWRVDIRVSDGGPNAFEFSTREQDRIEDILRERLVALGEDQTLVLSRHVFAGRGSRWAPVATFDRLHGFVTHDQARLLPRFGSLFVDASRALEMRAGSAWLALLGEVQDERPELFRDLES